MRLARLWQGCSRYGPEKFPHGSKMSATLLADFLIFARCSLWTSFVRVCVCVHVFVLSHIWNKLRTPNQIRPCSGTKQLHSGAAEISC